MKTPDATFELEYKHDRRAHRHRCRCCRRILTEGERVLMARVGRSGRTWAIHIDPCASVPFVGGFVWRDAMEAWGQDRLRRQGFKIPPHPLDSPISQ